jgi:hypothetical protein
MDINSQMSISHRKGLHMEGAQNAAHQLCIVISQHISLYFMFVHDAAMAILQYLLEGESIQLHYGWTARPLHLSQTDN